MQIVFLFLMTMRYKEDEEEEKIEAINGLTNLFQTKQHNKNPYTQ